MCTCVHVPRVSDLPGPGGTGRYETPTAVMGTSFSLSKEQYVFLNISNSVMRYLTKLVSDFFFTCAYPFKNAIFKNGFCVSKTKCHANKFENLNETVADKKKKWINLQASVWLNGRMCAQHTEDSEFNPRNRRIQRKVNLGPLQSHCWKATIKRKFSKQPEKMTHHTQ